MSDTTSDLFGDIVRRALELDRPSLCPEADYRASLTDGELWEYVYNGRRPGEPEPDLSWLPGFEPWGEMNDADLLIGVASACPVCGVPGACGYDAEGRPFVHVEEARHG